MATSARVPAQQSNRSSERCYQILRRMLTCAHIAPGTRLREVEWSEKLGVQRAALREAMVLLVHDGLLVRKASGGFFTPHLNEIDIDSVVDARVVLEVGGVRLTCARRLPDAEFDPVEKVCDVMEECHKAGLASGFAEADFLYHQKLLELSRNAPLIQMFSHSAQFIFVAAPISDDVRRTAELATIRDHREILAHVRNANVTEAVSRLEAHLVQTKNGLRAALR